MQGLLHIYAVTYLLTKNAEKGTQSTVGKKGPAAPGLGLDGRQDEALPVPGLQGARALGVAREGQRQRHRGVNRVGQAVQEQRAPQRLQRRMN